MAGSSKTRKRPGTLAAAPGRVVISHPEDEGAAESALASFSHRFEVPALGAPTMVLVAPSGLSGDVMEGFAVKAMPAAGRLVVDRIPVAQNLIRPGESGPAAGVAGHGRRQSGGNDEARALAAFLGAAFTAYGVNPAHAVGVGLGNGADLLLSAAFDHAAPLHRLALLHPERPDIPTGPAPDAMEVLLVAPVRGDGLSGQAASVFARRLEGLGVEPEGWLLADPDTAGDDTAAAVGAFTRRGPGLTPRSGLPN